MGSVFEHFRHQNSDFETVFGSILMENFVLKYLASCIALFPSFHHGQWSSHTKDRVENRRKVRHDELLLTYLIHSETDKMHVRLFELSFLSFVFDVCLGFASLASSDGLLRNRPVSLTQNPIQNKALCATTQETDPAITYNRRNALVGSAAVLLSSLSLPQPSLASDATTTTAEVTDKIYINVKGIPGADEPQRIVIGLFGKAAPTSVAKLKALVSNAGLTAPCRPRAERALQKEQLEANKVYNSCIEGQDQGVSLQYSQIWRVIKDERIDMGAVSGKFVAREYPDWNDAASGLKHDAPGVVSVRRGNGGGFGFSIYPGNGLVPTYMDDEHIVVGRVIDGLDIVQALNQVPVIQSSKVNYMALTGGTTTKNAPTRACRYGGAMYCNEFKPLIKLSITQTGVV